MLTVRGLNIFGHQNQTGAAQAAGSAVSAPVHQNTAPSDIFASGPREPSLHERIFTPLSAVTIIRSSGDRESGWQIASVTETGKITVTRGPYAKDYRARELLSLNPGLITPGTEFSVRRSNGQVEKGWTSGDIEGNRVTLTRDGMTKQVSIESLLNENPDMLPPDRSGGNRAAGGTEQTPPSQAMHKSTEDLSIRTLRPEESASITARAQFTPNPAGFYPGGAVALTKDFLQARGLQPVTSFAMGGIKIHLSPPYIHEPGKGTGRRAFVAYVEDEKGDVRVRTFYLSNSQGMWRSASHFGMGGWIGKGLQSEESTNLPIPLQKHLYEQCGQAHAVLDDRDSDTAFYGAMQFGGKEPPDEFSRDVNVRSFGRFTGETADRRAGLPESFELDRPQEGPDFSSVEDQYSITHPLHGQIDACTYKSYDGNNRYLFYRDGCGRSWLASVEEARAPLTGYGVRSTALDPGDLTLPAIEYDSQVPQGYRGPYLHNSYIDASAFTHRLPIVRAFMNSREASHG